MFWKDSMLENPQKNLKKLKFGLIEDHPRKLQ